MAATDWRLAQAGLYAAATLDVMIQPKSGFETFDRSIDVHISSLRKKLDGELPDSPTAGS